MRELEAPLLVHAARSKSTLWKLASARCASRSDNGGSDVLLDDVNVTTVAILSFRYVEDRRSFLSPRMMQMPVTAQNQKKKTR